MGYDETQRDDPRWNDESFDANSDIYDDHE